MKVVFLCLVLAVSVYADLPSYIKPCKRDDPYINKCFVENANEALKTAVKGDSVLQIPPVQPVLKHPGVKFENDEFYFQVKDTDVYGIETFRLLDAKVDLPKKSIWFQYKFDNVDWKGTYVAKNKKTNEEVVDKANITYIDNAYEITIDFDVKNNHITLTKLTAKFAKPPKTEFKLDNFDTHEVLKTLWEKYRQGFIDEGQNTVGQFLTLIFTNVFKTATYDEIFPPK